MIITIETTALDRFRASWPCNNLEDVGHVVVCLDDRSGDLVDLTAYDDEQEEIDIETIDGPALLALIDDAENFAERLPLPPDCLPSYVYA